MSSLGQKVNYIIAKIKRGDKLAYNSLYDLTYQHLKIVAYNYLFDKTKLDDVLNESYFRVFKYIKTCNRKKDGYNWMCKIVQNVAYDFNKQYSVYISIDKLECDRFFTDMDEKLIETNMLMSEIRNFSNTDQKILLLRFWWDLPIRDIADKLCMKKSTVHNRIKVLLKILFNKLKE